MAPVPPIDVVVISAVSPSSGSGRTSLVANGAVVLASGPLSPRALMTARGLGGDLRGRGQFEDAHDEDQGTVQGFELIYGPDHPETMMATSNLAVTARLIGDLPRARRVTAELRDRARRVLGDDATFTIRQTVNLAVVLRDLGDYAEAARLLRDARDGVARVHSEPDRLAVQRQQLVVDTRRRLNGRPLIEPDDTLLEQFRRMFGDNHTATRACRLNVAFARFLLGHTDTALEEGIKALDGYEAAVKDHPFTHATLVNVAVFRRAAGQIEEAVDDGQRALRALRAELPDRHPWTIDAMLNQAGNLAAAARWDEAAATAAQADDLYADVFDRLHPRSRLAQRNLREIWTAAEGGAYDPSTLSNLGAVDIDIPDT